MGKMNPETFTGGYPKDKFIIGQRGIHLYPEFNGIIREAEAAGKSEELTHQLETVTLPKMHDFICAKAKELGINLNEVGFDALPTEVKEEFQLNYLRALDDFGWEHLTYDLPGTPVLWGINKKMNDGASSEIWTPDKSGLIATPYYKDHKSGKSHITFYFDGPKDENKAAIALWLELSKSPEMVDVLEILLAHYMTSERFMDPLSGEWRAIITPSEIAAYRGRDCYGGSPKKMRERIWRVLIGLSNLKLTMRFEDKKTERVDMFGYPIPKDLLNIDSSTFQHKSKTWAEITYAPGSALSHFYKWTSRGHRALLRLDPDKYGLAKRIGRYSSLIGVPQAKHGVPAGAGFGKILDFVGLKPNFERPGRTVKQMAKAFNKLLEIGYWVKATDPEAIYHNLGKNFQAWLSHMPRMTLSPNIARIIERPWQPRKTKAES